MMHRVLARKLRKLGLSEQEPPDAASWRRFLAEVSDFYTAHDEDRSLLERAMSISSSEMRELMSTLSDRNEALQAEIVQHARTTEKLRHAATHDQLTGLPNRVALLEELRLCLEERATKSFALLFIDLDDFKIVNDSLGHEAGDMVLIDAAEKLQSACAEDAELSPMVCRLGGDEFVVLLRSVDDQDRCIQAADRIGSLLSRPFEIENRSLGVRASIGLLLSTEAYAEAGELLRDADTAMYRAKLGGKGRHAVFDSSMHLESMQRLKIENDLRDAIVSGDFFLVYQPQVDLERGGATGLEALLRWRHPTLGVVSPAQFVDLAEEIGLTVELGRIVFRQLARDIESWRRIGAPVETLDLAINVSKRQAIDGVLCDDIAAFCSEARVSPKRVVIELTENVTVGHWDAVKNVLVEVCAMGCRAHMDDFGTGLSSLSTLRQMPFQAVKIDRSFVRSVTEHREHAAIVASIVMLAHNLGMDVIAEGVEQVDHLVQLQALDCDVGQGYLFSRPLPASDVPAWLRSEQIDWASLRPAA